jgi:hypothetical protein
MRGELIFSLDCEGKWGVADALGGVHAALSDRALTQAYALLFDAFADESLRATMAFTSLFAVDEAELRAVAPALRALGQRGHRWYEPIARALGNEDFDGWIGKPYFERALRDGHELGWHGYSHHVLSDDAPREVVDFEFAGAGAVAQRHGVPLRSAVFPRNAVGNLDRLAAMNVACFRRSAAVENKLLGSRSVRVLDELNVLKSSVRPDVRKHAEGVASLPAGSLLNWSRGPRAAVPDVVTIARWRHMLDDAARRGGHVHMWFHPHNLVTAPRMRDTFAAVVRYAGALVRRGDLVNRTMIEALDEGGGPL